MRELDGHDAERVFTFQLMSALDFTCRFCFAHCFVVVGRSRLGAKLYACSGCTIVFMDPQKFCSPVKAVKHKPEFSPNSQNEKTG